jgi:hypothetical protein
MKKSRCHGLAECTPVATPSETIRDHSLLPTAGHNLLWEWRPQPRGCRGMGTEIGAAALSEAQNGADPIV